MGWLLTMATPPVELVCECVCVYVCVCVYGPYVCVEEEGKNNEIIVLAVIHDEGNTGH